MYKEQEQTNKKKEENHNVFDFQFQTLAYNSQHDPMQQAVVNERINTNLNSVSQQNGIDNHWNTNGPALPTTTHLNPIIPSGLAPINTNLIAREALQGHIDFYLPNIMETSKLFSIDTDNGYMPDLN